MIYSLRITLDPRKEGFPPFLSIFLQGIDITFTMGKKTFDLKIKSYSPKNYCLEKLLPGLLGLLDTHSIIPLMSIF